MILASLVDASRMQFALTAMFHWIFVPLTLGLGFIVVSASPFSDGSKLDN